ncbi:AAA-like domain-containing protein [Iningainema tapete]|uniref:AAA-like domain-containing protein n=1 Tax=Iningainema tapete TaxID=2806730 RepID=UPI003080BAC3
MEEFLEAVEKILLSKPLGQIQRFVLSQAWQGKTYEQMALGSGYGSNYMKEVGSQLWQDLSEALGEKVTKKNLHIVLSQAKQSNINQLQQDINNTSIEKNSQLATASKINFPSGPVPIDSPLYINRSTVEELVYTEIIQPGCLIRIKAPKKMGKSSLLLRMIAYAQEQHYQTVYLDFQEADEEVFASLDKFLRWLCIYVSKKLNLAANLDDYWDAEMGSKVSCKIYFQEYLLEQLPNPLVLALNEVNRIFEHPNIAQDFLPMLRFWHEQAKQDQTWQKLRLVVVHTTEIYIPLKINQSPFNVGLTVTLPPLTLAEIQDLAQRYELPWAKDSHGWQRLESLQAMMGGHPYLIALALYHLHHQDMTLDTLLQTASSPTGIYSQHLRELMNLLQAEPQLIYAIQHVVSSNEKVELDAIAAYKLESMGLVKLNGNLASPSCDLYRLYFKDHLVT